jgi:hypothetical protein
LLGENKAYDSRNHVTALRRMNVTIATPPDPPPKVCPMS